MAEAIPPTLQVLWQQLALIQQGTPVSSNTTLPTKQKPPPYKPPPTLPPPPPQNRGSFVLSHGVAGRRRHRQRLGSVNPTGHCDSTPTRRKAAPEEAQGESPTQATQNAKAHRHAHRHTSANSHRHQHSHWQGLD